MRSPSRVTPTAVRLTAHGEGFLCHAEPMQTTLAAAAEETRSAVSSVTGRVRIAITDTVSEYLLPKVIAVIRRQLPLVAFEPVECNRGDIEEGLRSGEFDLAVVLVSNLSNRTGHRARDPYSSPPGNCGRHWITHWHAKSP